MHISIVCGLHHQNVRRTICLKKYENVERKTQVQQQFTCLFNVCKSHFHYVWHIQGKYNHV
jgi:hypothetical protein